MTNIMTKRTIETLLRLRKDGVAEIVTENRLKRAISLTIGANRETIKTYTNYTQTLGFLTPISPGHYRINWNQVYTTRDSITKAK